MFHRRFEKSRLRWASLCQSLENAASEAEIAAAASSIRSALTTLWAEDADAGADRSSDSDGMEYPDPTGLPADFVHRIASTAVAVGGRPTAGTGDTVTLRGRAAALGLVAAAFSAAEYVSPETLTVLVDAARAPGPDTVPTDAAVALRDALADLPDGARALTHVSPTVFIAAARASAIPTARSALLEIAVAAPGALDGNAASALNMMLASTDKALPPVGVAAAASLLRRAVETSDDAAATARVKATSFRALPHALSSCGPAFAAVSDELRALAATPATDAAEAEPEAPAAATIESTTASWTVSVEALRAELRNLVAETQGDTGSVASPMAAPTGSASSAVRLLSPQDHESLSLMATATFGQDTASAHGLFAQELQALELRLAAANSDDLAAMRSSAVKERRLLEEQGAVVEAEQRAAAKAVAALEREVQILQEEAAARIVEVEAAREQRADHDALRQRHEALVKQVRREAEAAAKDGAPQQRLSTALGRVVELERDLRCAFETQQSMRVQHLEARQQARLRALRQGNLRPETAAWAKERIARLEKDVARAKARAKDHEVAAAKAKQRCDKDIAAAAERLSDRMAALEVQRDSAVAKADAAAAQVAELQRQLGAPISPKSPTSGPVRANTFVSPKRGSRVNSLRTRVTAVRSPSMDVNAFRDASRDASLDAVLNPKQLLGGGRNPFGLRD